MNKLEELIAKQESLNGQIVALFGEEGKVLSAEDRTKIQTLKTELDGVTAQVSQAKTDKADRDAAVTFASTLTSSAGRKTSGANEVVIGKVEDNWKKDPNKGFETHREFLTSVISAGQGREPDKRLKFLTVGSDEGRGSSDPAGGFLLPVGFSPQLLKVDPEDDPIGAATRKIPMEQSIVKIPARTDKDHTTSVSGGLTVTRRPDTVAATQSQTTFEQVVLEAFSLFGLSYATEEILMDSPISFIALLDSGFSDQFKYHLTNERLFGTGTGEYLGAGSAQNPSLVSVAKETNQPATTFVYENAIAMRARCWGYSNAFWIANHDTLPSFVLMNQAVGTGGFPVFQPGPRLGEASSDIAGTFLGRPLIFSEYPKTLGTQADVILANFNEYLEGTYQPMQSAESIHVRFVNHERAFKFWMRNAGRPWWKSPLTPRNSAKTLSPFVVCDVRS